MPHPSNDEERRRLVDRLRSEFFLPPLLEHKYRVEQVIGEGSYGVVCSAVDVETGEKVAVKRIMRVFEEAPEATRTLRELKFLRLLKDHENIISIKDVLLPSDRDRFDDIFVVLELMPADLTRVLRSNIELSGEHIRWLVFQLIRGIYFIHTSRVFHRDLKPSNILINAQCDLRIVDFGLSRAAFDCQEPDVVFWTDYVATRWYRAPELIMAGSSNYTTAIDMWSVGCIFAEMLNNGRALFPGHNPEEQLQLIVEACGSPTPEAISAVRDARAREHLSRMPPRKQRPMTELFPDADPLALDLLAQILEFDPAKRISAEDALKHPYLQMDIVTRGTPIDMEEFAFERRSHTTAELRALFLEEILKYHPSRRDEYMRPCHNPVLRYAPVGQAARFREAMTASLNGTEPPRPYDSMPNQQLSKYYNDAMETSNRRSRPQSHGGSVEHRDPQAHGAMTTTTDLGSNQAERLGVGSTTQQRPNANGEVIVRTTGTLPHQPKRDDRDAHEEMVPDGGEELQLMRYTKFASGESASSTVAFRQDSEQLGASVEARRVSETVDSMMEGGDDVAANGND